jgi:lysyl-tRNA synthetase class 2
MEKNEFLEVETPTLGAIASGANAKPFITHHNALDVDMRLRIAPELYLKRLLVGGLDRVYEIGRNYRNEGIDTRHNPEFTMMESYQAYGNFNHLLSFSKRLIQHVTQYLTMNLPPHAASYYKTWWQEATYDLFSFVEVTMEQAVRTALEKIDGKTDDEFTKFEFNRPIDEAPAEAYWRRNHGMNWIAFHHLLDQCQTRGERLALYFEFFAEPFLTRDYRNPVGSKSLPVFITDYPKEISPLARPNDKDPTVCDRFELFVDGRELANAFQELNDPEEQAVRFQEQLESSNKDPMDFDADYVEALEHGMPPAIGFGIGIDRLVMLLTNTTSIKDVILFPTLRPEK